MMPGKIDPGTGFRDRWDQGLWIGPGRPEDLASCSLNGAPLLRGMARPILCSRRFAACFLPAVGVCRRVAGSAGTAVATSAAAARTAPLPPAMADQPSQGQKNYQ